jgi:prepilin-type N-terminal cleavage/methylation domain-containing protein
MRLRNNKGFTLVEMVVVLAIFTVIIIISSSAFQILLSQSVKLYKSEESNIEGVVGLEMLRHDLEQGGFGLPYSFQSTAIIYQEAGYAPANISGLNDAPSNIPRAFASLDNLAATADSNSINGGTFTTLAGTDYLAIKGTSLGANDASQRWSYLSYSSSGKPPKSWPSENLAVGDKAIVVSRTFTDAGGYTNQLVYNASTPASYWLTYATSPMAAPFAPSATQTFYLYGLTSGADVGMPFNRVDYFVANPSGSNSQLPASCAPHTGILYRAQVSQNSASPGGKLTYAPILDCVADMQVVYGWNLADSSGNIVTDPSLTGSGLVDTWTNADGSTPSTGLTLPSGTYVKDSILTDPGHIRTKLKIIKVYLLAQNGLKDPNYKSRTPIYVGDQGEASITRSGGYTITADMLNYRWKVYRLIIKPKNLISNQ